MAHVDRLGAEKRLIQLCHFVTTTSTVSKRRTRALQLLQASGVVVDETPLITQLLAQLLLASSLDHVYVHVVGEQLARVADVNSRVEFVTGQHPDLDIGLDQFGNTFGYTVLQFVLDGR